MKRLLALFVMAEVAVVLLAFSIQGNNQQNGAVKEPKADVSAQANNTLKEKQENDFLEESKTVLGAYEFTRAGDYRFMIIDVVAPMSERASFCLEGNATSLQFENKRIIIPEVKNEGRCITGLGQNLSSNEYVVKGVKAGAKIQVWTSNPGVVLKTTGIHCTNSKWDCNLYGPQAEWEGDGYKFKVMVMGAH
jgi:hypothetical protein